jgi:trans-2,3-dihydro-3-hydroxyanthranilate isomerase
MFKFPYSYRHIDVFSESPLSGNGLIVFENAQGLSDEQMQKITQEMRQYETLFLFPSMNLGTTHRVKARIFTLDEELDFAGHPILGAAAVLHEKYASNLEHSHWQFDLNHKSVLTRVVPKASHYLVAMDQGKPEFGPPLSSKEIEPILQDFNLSSENLHSHFPAQVVSTGLAYLILPLKNGLEKAKLIPCDLESKLSKIGAKFVYLLDIERLEARTWDNEGKVEDIATGSAAGPAGAYLVFHKKEPAGQTFSIQQGRFLQRNSLLNIHVKATVDSLYSVEVSGPVCMFARGILDA